MDLEEIQELIKVDSEINPLNLGEESLNISKIHGKWIVILCNEQRLLKAINIKLSNVTKERIEYYTGKAPDSVYKEKGAFNMKILNKDLQLYLDSDIEINAIKTKKEMLEIKIGLINEFIKGLNQRTFNIKNAIEWKRFQNGLN